MNAIVNGARRKQRELLRRIAPAGMVTGLAEATLKVRDAAGLTSCT